MSLFLSSLLPLEAGVSGSSHCRGCRGHGRNKHVLLHFRQWDSPNACAISDSWKMISSCFIFFSYVGVHMGKCTLFGSCPCLYLVGCCLDRTQTVSGQIFALTGEDKPEFYVVSLVLKQEQEQSIQPKQCSSPGWLRLCVPSLGFLVNY